MKKNIIIVALSILLIIMAVITYLALNGTINLKKTTENNNQEESKTEQNSHITLTTTTMDEFVDYINKNNLSSKENIQSSVIAYEDLRFVSFKDPYDGLGLRYNIYSNWTKINKKYDHQISIGNDEIDEMAKAYNVDNEAILILGLQIPNASTSVFEITMFDKNGNILFEEYADVTELKYLENEKELTYTKIEDYEALLSECAALKQKPKDTAITKTLKYKYENQKMNLVEETKYTVSDQIKQYCQNN